MRELFSRKSSVMEKLFVVSFSLLLVFSFAGLAQEENPGEDKDKAEVTWGIEGCDLTVNASDKYLGTAENASVGQTLDGTAGIRTEGLCPYQVQVEAISADGPDGELVGPPEILTDGGVFEWRVKGTNVTTQEGTPIDVQDTLTSFENGIGQSKTVGKVKWGGNVDWTMFYSYEIDRDDRVGDYKVELLYTVTSVSGGFVE